MAIVDGWRFELVSRIGQTIGTLDSVLPGAQVSGNVHAEVRWAGSLEVHGEPGVDWNQVRVRPVRHWDDGTQSGATPYGLYVVKPAEGAEPSTGTVTKLDLYDRTIVVSEDRVTDTFTVPAGRNVVGAVAEIIGSTGETGVALTPTEDVTRTDLVWEPGTTKLRIINDLAEHAGYFALWADLHGQFRFEPYTAPQDRPVAYKFMPGEHATFLPDVGWRAEATVHNRVVCVSQETGESPAMVAVAENTNPASPWSFQAQGRWVTRVEENVEAASQAVLNQHVQRLLAGEGTAGRVVSRELLPEAVELNAVVTSSSGGREVVENITVSCEPARLMKVTSREVA